MKIDQLITFCLYEKHNVSLQGIGTFTLDPTFLPVDDTDKVKKPVEGVVFNYDPNAKSDMELTEYVKAKTGKMLPLAESDIDSFLLLGKQLLHIGKPFSFEGIGHLTKKQNGGLEFSAGHFLSQRYAEVSYTELKTREPKLKENFSSITEAGESFFDQVKQNKPSNGKILAGLAGLLALGALLYGAFWVYNNKMNTAEASIISDTAVNLNNLQPVVVDTPAVVDVNKSNPSDTIIKTNNNLDSLSNTTAQSVTNTVDGNAFNIVFEVAKTKLRAETRVGKLNSFGTKAAFEMLDSVTYNLYVPVVFNIADSTRILDSIRLLYGKPGQLSFIKK
jgi:hypothetical protein